MKGPSSKKLLILRHAHREVAHPSDDNGLSAKGRLQSRAVANQFQKSFGNIDAKILSSPRLRCQETLEPLADYLGISIEISKWLDEGASGNLVNRIDDFTLWWKTKGPAFLIICSHGDWIPEFFSRTLQSDLSLKKAGWAEIEFDGQKVFVKKIIQEWDLKNL